MATNVPGVPLRSSALRSLSTSLVIRSAAVVTGTTVSLVSTPTVPLTTVLSGLTVARVYNTSLVAGVLNVTIQPSASASTEISPVYTPSLFPLSVMSACGVTFITEHVKYAKTFHWSC